MVDDLGNRPKVESSLLPLADAMDAAAKEVAAATAHIRRAAFDALDVKAYETAATLFDQVRAAYVSAGIGGHLVEDLRRRAADCRNLRDLHTRWGKR